MYAEERRARIGDILRQNQRVTVAVLARTLAATPETIRRDLRELEANGVLKRTHGGAICGRDWKSCPEISILARKTINHEAKTRIARAAAAFVEDGDVIAIDNSTTAFRMLDFIPRSRTLTIVTNSIMLVTEALSLAASAWTCVCLGGVVNRGNLSTIGSLAHAAAAAFAPDKLFMSCAGLDAEGRLTEGNLHDVEMKREFIRLSQRKFLLVDSAKLGQTSPVIEEDVGVMDCVVTNADADRKTLAMLRKKHVAVVLDTEAPAGTSLDASAALSQ